MRGRGYASDCRAGADEPVTPADADAESLDGSLSYVVQSSVGGLLEMRAGRLECLDDLLAFHHAIHRAARRLQTRTVVFADYRRGRPFPQDVGDAWCRFMRQDNARISASGILLDPMNHTFNLQFERVVRCAGNPARRIFHDAGELRDWLSHATTAAELARINDLLRNGR